MKGSSSDPHNHTSSISHAEHDNASLINVDKNKKDDDDDFDKYDAKD